MNKNLKAPFPYFGGKSRIADRAWELLGDVKTYIEPFFGSGAVLFARPKNNSGLRNEIVNDRDCFVANFWRAMKADPDAVAYYADNPVNHADQCARRNAMLRSAMELRKSCMTDDEYYDAKIAGYWCWCQSVWIGHGMITSRAILQCEKEPFCDCQIPKLVHNNGVNTRRDLNDWFRCISNRLRDVRVTCGDYTRVLGGNWRTNGSDCGIFLDPPYGKNCDSTVIYGNDCDGVSHSVREWCIVNGAKPKNKIMLCGYADEHDELLNHGWDKITWTAQCGYARPSTTGNNNRTTETIWISPEIAAGQKKNELFTRDA